jgi:sec-independent protein translocase protein TatA
MGPLELGLIAGVVILLFGASKIPQLARALGRAPKETQAGYEAATQDDK